MAQEHEEKLEASLGQTRPFEAQRLSTESADPIEGPPAIETDKPEAEMDTGDWAPEAAAQRPQAQRPRPARITPVRSFVQTSFEELGSDPKPPAEGERKFVVSLPEEIYQIGMPKGQGAPKPAEAERPTPPEGALSYEDFVRQYDEADAAEAEQLFGQAFEQFQETYQHSLTEPPDERRSWTQRLFGRRREAVPGHGDEDFAPVDREADWLEEGQAEQAQLRLQEVFEMAQAPAGAPAEGDGAAGAPQDAAPDVDDGEGPEDEFDEAADALEQRVRLFARPAGDRPPQHSRLDDVAPDKLPEVLAARAKAADRGGRQGLVLMLLQFLPLFWTVGPLEAPAFVTPGLLGVAGALLLALQLLAGRELFRMAAEELEARRPGFACMGLLIAGLAMLQALFYGRNGAPVYTAYPALLCARLQQNRRAALRKARIDSKLVCSPQVKRLPRQALQRQQGRRQEAELRILFTERRGDLEGFFTQSLAPSPAARLAPFLLGASPAVFVLFALLNRRAQTPLPLLTVALAALCALLPIGLLEAFDKPFYALSDQLRRRGSTLAGAPGALALARTDEVLLSDADLFGGRPPVVAGLKLFNGCSVEDAMLITTSLAQMLDLPLQKGLLAMIDHRDDRLMTLTEVKHLEGAGVQAFINGEIAVLGTQDFLRQQAIIVRREEAQPHGPEGGRVPLYLAVGGRLAACFTVDYGIPAATAGLLKKLCGAGVGLLLCTMDPLLTGPLVERLAGLAPGSVRTLTFRARQELEAAAEAGQPLMGAAGSANPLCLARLVLGALCLQSASRLGIAVSLLAVAAGTAAAAVLIGVGVFAVGSLTSLLLFQLAWLLPVWCVGFAAGRIFQ
ncbi:MAG: hypothetical protein GXX99_03955 [Clostridiales bacterium]|nr:hypothetical protein [Clostridiales bacterium]